MRRQGWKSGLVALVIVSIGMVTLHGSLGGADGRSGLLRGWSFHLWLIGWCIFVGILAKAQLWRNLATSIEIVPVTIAEFAGVDDVKALYPEPLPAIPALKDKPKEKPLPVAAARFEERTRELVELGFRPVVEGRYVINRRETVPTYTRMFQRQDGTWAQLFQMFPSGFANTAVHLTLLSYFQDGWVVADGTYRANWVYWLMRRPRVLGKRHAETAPVAGILALHRERCRKVERELGVHIVSLDYQAHIASTIEGTKEIRALILRRSILLAMLQVRIFRKNKTEWWGEYHKYAAAKN
jgi:hypothetical protein